MRAALPWIVCAVVFLLFPDDLDFNGVVRNILISLLVTALLIPVLVHYAILRSLPERVQVTVAGPADVPPELDRILHEYETLGFRRLSPMWFHLPNMALVVPLAHGEGAMCATVYRIEGAQKKVFYDVVSMLDAPDGALTTAMDAGAGTLPVEPTMLRQIFPGASPDDLVLWHREALRQLESHRVGVLEVAAPAVPGLLRRSFAIHRRVFLRQPVKNTFVAIWRTLNKQSPYHGAILDQPAISAQIDALRARSRARETVTV